VPSLTGYCNTEAILGDADIAMYRAKNEGKARAVIFEPPMRAQVETRLHIENHLRDGILRGEFELHYQPIVRLDGTKEIVAAEALVRWRTPDGLIYPAAFIDIAEETGLIIPLGNWVFREACETARGWNQARHGRPPVGISINLSALQFGQTELVDTLEDIVTLSGIDPGTVTIEITERSTMADPDRALATFKRLKSIGFRLAIDDFGTGYSSLSYLHRFPIDILKIDRSFISNLDESSDGEKIVSAILALSDGLGIQAVAEGVETVPQIDRLKRLGCKFAQGYVFARPLTKEAIEVLLAGPPPAQVPASGA
jgi:EAL domain-containing protein (putative c-di-GMP-specific phosphodiesterase class I)